MQVKVATPIDANERPYLSAWDTTARKYHRFFEDRRIAARETVIDLKANLFTAFRSPVQLRNRYTEIDSLDLRQKLGDISSTELKEAQRHIGSSSYFFTKSRREPCLIYAWSTLPVLSFLGLGSASTLYGLTRGYNLLWVPLAIVPVSIYALLAYSRQPREVTDNAYRYILAKRVAAVEYEANSARLASLEFTQTAEYDALSKSLSSSGQTLYDLEASLVSRISQGKF